MTDYTREIAALKKALATGAKRVIFDGRSVEFRTPNEMRQTLAWLEAEQDPAGAARVSYTLGQFSRGDDI